MITEVLEGVRQGGLWGEAGCEVIHHRHVCEVEATRSTGVEVVVIHGEMPVAVGVGAGRSNVRGVEDVGIDESELSECQYERSGRITGYSHLS